MIQKGMHIAFLTIDQKQITMRLLRKRILKSNQLFISYREEYRQPLCWSGEWKLLDTFSSYKMVDSNSTSLSPTMER